MNFFRGYHKCDGLYFLCVLILNLQARYVKYNVKVNSMHIKTLFEPCIICKKQILIYKNVHNIAEVSVSATKRNSRQYVQNNEHLKELINNIK